MGDRWRDMEPCLRCGKQRRVQYQRVVSPICRDCRQVARDLGEIDLWTGAA